MEITALTLLFPTAIVAFISSQWRWKIAALAAQYILVFFLLTQSWPVSLAAVKWIAGWISCAILAYTEAGLSSDSSNNNSSFGTFFKILASILVVIVGLALAAQLSEWANAISLYQAIGGLMLIGMGLISAALSSRILASTIALLTIFSGFELIYSAVEISTLLAGLLALINLGIAMTGAYLILLPTLADSR